MVLNQNEYTMASLGFNYQKPPLFLPNQTRPPSFLINKNQLPPLSHPKNLPLPPPSSFPFFQATGGGLRRGGASPLPPSTIRFPSILLLLHFQTPSAPPNLSMPSPYPSLSAAQDGQDGGASSHQRDPHRLSRSHLPHSPFLVVLHFIFVLFHFFGEFGVRRRREVKLRSF